MKKEDIWEGNSLPPIKSEYRFQFAFGFLGMKVSFTFLDFFSIHCCGYYLISMIRTDISSLTGYKQKSDYLDFVLITTTTIIINILHFLLAFMQVFSFLFIYFVILDF